MKYLNISEGFDPYNSKIIHSINFESFVFNGGEPHIKIKDHISESVTITHRINSFNDFGLLAIAVDALRRIGIKDIYLYLPYFPGARQDRVMIIGEPLTVKVYADMINVMNLSSVTIYDPHSEVTPALINNCIAKTNHKFVEKCLEDIYGDIIEKPFHLISPDSGANKKIKDLSEYLFPKFPFFITKCDKTRNVKDGSISGFEVYNTDLEGRTCIIVDDICDGGGTFIGLAKELKKKNAGNLYLIVTHGIFSKGLTELFKHFKTIFTTDSISNIKSTNQLKQIKL